jgi:hypothetical protein
MAIADRISTLVLREFRLRVADTTGEAARIVAADSSGIEPGVPLLTSIDDDRDVATVRALHIGETTEGDARQRCELDRLVASWRPPAQYAPRITERSTSPPTHYRLAVTGSGINNAEAEPPTPREMSEHGAATPVGLLWIGVPVGTYAGSLVLLGSSEDPVNVRTDPGEWARPLSRSLGVRIYESQS